MRDRSSVLGSATYLIEYLGATYALIWGSSHALAGSHDAGYYRSLLAAFLAPA